LSSLYGSKGLSYNLNGSNFHMLMVIMIGDDKSIFYRTSIGSLDGSNNYRLIILHSDSWELKILVPSGVSLS
jgi:hypothetical protein